MPLTITDEQLQQMNLTEQQARIEIACRLFEAKRLDLWPAAQLAGLSRSGMEAELRQRNIAVYEPTVEEFEQEMRVLDEFRRKRETA